MQVKNIEAERKACDVRLRAERRAGELLAELPRATKADAANTWHAPATVAGAPMPRPLPPAA